MSFSDLGLSDITLKAVTEVGYTEPTSIQKQAIPSILGGLDVVGIAQTGTGKTAGYTLPMIDILASGRAKARMPRSLILAPTRELATQIGENFVKYGKYHKLSMALLIGGESMPEQKKILNHGVDVLIATPGRMLDLFSRGLIIMNDIKVLVIDEADRMLDMGFMPDVKKIISFVKIRHQTLLFSATMDKEIKEIASEFMQSPKEIVVTPPSTTASTIEHFIVYTPVVNSKKDMLKQLLEAEDVGNAMIFLNKKIEVDKLINYLKRHHFSALALHGDMSQFNRTEAIEKFRSGECKILVCSDVAARGLDLPDVSHVFNFDAPFKPEDYVHRIGRTGRAGREGKAFTIITDDDFKALANIETVIGGHIPLSEEFGSPTEFKEKMRIARKNKFKDITTTNPNKHKTPKSKKEQREDTKRIEAELFEGKTSAKRPPRSSGKKSNLKATTKRILQEKSEEKAFGKHTPAFWNIKID